MKILGGYGKKTLETNIQAYVEDGYEESEAKRICKKMARKWFLKTNPDKPVPEYLLEETNGN